MKSIHNILKENAGMDIRINNILYSSYSTKDIANDCVEVLDTNGNKCTVDLCGEITYIKEYTNSSIDIDYLVNNKKNHIFIKKYLDEYVDNILKNLIMKKTSELNNFFGRNQQFTDF